VDNLPELIVEIAPFAIAGMIVPSWTKYVILLLFTGKPIRNAYAYVAGNAAFRLILGFVALYIAQVPAIEQTAQDPPGPTSAWLLIPGLLLWGFAVYLWRKPPADEEKVPGWLQVLDAVKPWHAFLGGFVMVALPGIQYVYFFGAVGVIAAAPYGPVGSFLLLIALIAFLELMLLTPIVIFSLSGERALETVGRIKDWLGRNEYKVGAAVLFLFGAYLVLSGIQSL
jgi:hypothetical protein